MGCREVDWSLGVGVAARHEIFDFPLFLSAFLILMHSENSLSVFAFVSSCSGVILVPFFLEPARFPDTLLVLKTILFWLFSDEKPIEILFRRPFRLSFTL